MNPEMEIGTNRKALQINLDAKMYGTFAEIGAGQEVARRFFYVGGAVGTIAKTMSAYDMTFSDAIYGPTDRYVSRVRLRTMLDHEYDLLLERLNAKLGVERTFFVFADTVAARSFKQHNESHGWLGVRFQTQPRGEPSQIIIHVRMLDETNLEQQEALGVIGVNLLYGAFYHSQPERLISSLQENLAPSRIQVDMIKFSGPAFAKIDNRLMSLQLVSQGLTDAVMFTADGETVQNLLAEGQLNHADFLARVDILGALGRTVLISKFGEYYRLAGYLARYTNRMIGLVMGVPSLIEIFDEKYYLNLEGGILEALGRMFKHGLKLYVYPMIDEKTGKITTATQVEVAPNLRSLFQYLIDNRHIEEIGDYQKDFLRIYPPAVLAKLKAGDESWEEMVPPEVVQIIKEREFFGYRAAVAA